MKTQNEDPIAQSLGIDTLPKASDDAPDSAGQLIDLPPRKARPLQIVQANTANADIENDYTYARTNAYDIIEKGVNALEDLTEIARQSQHPRSYEALSTLITSLTNANKQILDIQKDLKKIKEQKDAANNAPAGGDINIQQAVFVGTTAELLKLRKQVNANTAILPSSSS